VAHIHKLSISLTVEQIAILRAAVDTGEYATTSEIIREALQDWQVKRELRQQDTDQLRKLWDEGKTSGEPAPLDFDALKTEARQRLHNTPRLKADGS
jgi:antitoxin ParD1/3/4